MNSRELRAMRKEKAERKFAALAAPAAPPVELDEAFFTRSDLAYSQAKADGSLTRWRDERALAEQMQRRGTGV